MAREYMLIKTLAGIDLQITAEGQPEEHVRLHAVSDRGLLREAEEIINRHFYGLQPFPGFDWEPISSGWVTTDHDVRNS